jgi:hypothetical protein
MFYVGQKVVCVNAGPLVNPIGNVHVAPQLEEGRVYTVLAVAAGKGLLLMEVAPSPPHPAFNAERFRPVVERKTDISIFRAMLNPSKQGADA